MKCIGNKCNVFSEYSGHEWCNELKTQIWIDKECRLLEKINEIRSDLLRKCALFEKILNTEP